MLTLLLGSTLFLAAAPSAQAQACIIDEAAEKLVDSATPQTKYEAGSRPVFQAPSFPFGGETYQKYGNPRPFTAAELKPYAKMGDALLFIDTGFNEDILYVMTSSAGCKFQPYFRKGAQ